MILLNVCSFYSCKILVLANLETNCQVLYLIDIRSTVVWFCTPGKSASLQVGYYRVLHPTLLSLHVF